MENAELRAKREEDDRSALLQGANLRLPFTSHPPNGFDPSDSMRGIPTNIMVAGQRTGKTSFLRLLLETSDISPLATKDQVASVAKFVHSSTGHTPHIRVASIDINVDIEGLGSQQRLALTLVDTPSLNFEEQSSSERLVQDMLRHIDSRFAEGIDDVSHHHPLALDRSQKLIYSIGMAERGSAYSFVRNILYLHSSGSLKPDNHL